MRLSVLFTCLFFWVTTAKSQSGAIILKAGVSDLPLGTFASIQAAYDAIPAPVLQPFRIEIGSAYTGANETFPIVFGARSGTSTFNTITLRPATGVSAVSVGGSVSGGNILTINDADYVTIDGRAGGIGATGALTFTNTASTSNSNTIQLINGASNNTITYCTISNASVTAAARGLSFGVSASNTSGNSNNLISFCRFSGGRYTINSGGTAVNPNTGNRIYGCDVFNFTFAGFWGQSGTGKVYIDSCKFFHTMPVNDGVYAIIFDSQSDSAIITRNNIYDLNSGTDIAQVKGISVRSSLASNYLYIYNNFINLASSPASTNVSGIELTGSSATVTTNAGIYYNTIKIGGTLSSGGTSGNVVSCALLRSATTASNVFDIKNNIFVNERVGGTAGVQHPAIALTNNGGIINIDYNIYNSSSGNLVRSGAATYATFAAYQATATSGNETNSNSQPVQFIAPADLHLADALAYNQNLMALPVAGITRDIDDQQRGSIPYRGADEISGSPLPVSLLNFSVQKKDIDVLLLWSTTTEISNLGFSVERSYDGIHFTSIGFVKGALNSGTAKEYAFNDAGAIKPGTNKLFYRLLQTDLDNRKQYSAIRFITAGGDTRFNIQLYPNPVTYTPNLYIYTPVKSLTTIWVSDQLGRKLLSRRVALNSGENTIALPEVLHLVAGTYFVTVAEDGCKAVKFVRP